MLVCAYRTHTRNGYTSRQKLVGYIKIERLGYYSCWVRTNPFNFSKTFLFLRSFESLFSHSSKWLFRPAVKKLVLSFRKAQNLLTFLWRFCHFGYFLSIFDHFRHLLGRATWFLIFWTSRRIGQCSGYKTWCSNFLSLCSCWLGYSPRRISPDICILVWYISCSMYMVRCYFQCVIGKTNLNFVTRNKLIFQKTRNISYILK